MISTLESRTLISALAPWYRLAGLTRRNVVGSVKEGDLAEINAIRFESARTRYPRRTSGLAAGRAPFPTQDYFPRTQPP
jgi:hypothetical protein